jgi:hypothetical protein
MTSILFDATFRSGNHFAVALLKKAFPNIKLYWGYKDKHNPESFNLPKDKFNYYMTIIRKPTDSIASQILLQPEINIDEIIVKYKLFLESVLNNKEKIHIYSFEDLINEPTKIIENIAYKLNIQSHKVDIDELIKSFHYYNSSNFYVVPTSNQDILDEQKALIEIKSKLSQKSFTDLMTEVDELYEKLSVFKIKTR